MYLGYLNISDVIKNIFLYVYKKTLYEVIGAIKCLESI